MQTVNYRNSTSLIFQTIERYLDTKHADLQVCMCILKNDDWSFNKSISIATYKDDSVRVMMTSLTSGLKFPPHILQLIDKGFGRTGNAAYYQLRASP